MAQYGDNPVILEYCEEAAFAAYLKKDPSRRISTFRFYIKNGTAWAVKCGSRIYQRV